MKASITLAAAMLTMASAPARADCIDDAAAFADKICGGVRTIGKANLVNADGDLNATAKVLIAKALGELSDKLDAEKETYEKILQEQLSAERSSLRKCGIAMARVAIDQVCFRATR